jgi:hypothetical protein
MKKLLILFMLLPCVLIGQAYDSISAHHTHLMVKTNLLSPITNFPTVNIGIEKSIAQDFITDNVSLSGEFGYQFWGSGRYDTAFIKPSGYKMAAQLRFYGPIAKKHAKKNALSRGLTGVYFGLDFFYRENKSNHQMTYRNANDTIFRTDSFWFEKKVMGGDLILGWQDRLFNHFYADAFMGIGLAHRKVMDYNMEFSSNNDDQIAGLDLAPYFGWLYTTGSSGTSLAFRFELSIAYAIY